jgi:CRP/FNR family transcriptional regulator, cyclic AMP receptor protein
MLQLREKASDFMDHFSTDALDLPQDVWGDFAKSYEATHYTQGQMIYFQESQAECFYYLKAGRVKTFISSEDGSEKVLTVYRSGNVFGEAAFFDELPRVSSAITLSECEIVRINRTMLADKLAKNPELALALLKYLARTVRLLSAHVDDMAFLQVDQRLARMLLTYHAENGVIRVTQDELASAVSANRVTVCRILKQFQEKKLLTTGYGTIQILDREKLQNLISQ